MLTSGEFVLRKRVVDKFGSQNLMVLNAGAQPLAETLAHIASAEPQPMRRQRRVRDQ